MVLDQSDSLAVNWTQAVRPGRCNITSNTVNWYLCSTGEPVGNMTLDPTESYIITGLHPWTTYQVCVRAATQGGNGPDGQCQNRTTDEDSKLTLYLLFPFDWADTTVVSIQSKTGKGNEHLTVVVFCVVMVNEGCRIIL